MRRFAFVQAFIRRARNLHPGCIYCAGSFTVRKARNTIMALAILAYAAIIGLLGWAAWNSGVTEKAMFVVNVVFLWMSAIWFFGYPALIGPAVLAAIAYLALLVVMTSSDLRVPVTVPARQRPDYPDDES
jgi:hypothetical protein